MTKSNLSIREAMRNLMCTNYDIERSMYLELALAAMDELIKMALAEIDHGRNRNQEEYMRTFTPCTGLKPNGYITEAMRESGMVIINSLALVETLMDVNRWTDMFPCMISRASTTDMVANDMGGTRNGAPQLHAEGVWAVVDVSIDYIGETSWAPTFLNCRRLPSGCVVQNIRCKPQVTRAKFY